MTLWGENWPAIDLYRRIHTQWRVGAAGAVGLDYNVVFHELDRRNLGREEYDGLMEDIRVIETAAMGIFSE